MQLGTHLNSTHLNLTQLNSNDLISCHLISSHLTAGCILYELATLRSPFKEKGMTFHGLCDKVKHARDDPPPDCYSEELRELVFLMLSPDPCSRPSIAEVIASPHLN